MKTKNKGLEDLIVNPELIKFTSKVDLFEKPVLKSIKRHYQKKYDLTPNAALIYGVSLNTDKMLDWWNDKYRRDYLATLKDDTTK